MTPSILSSKRECYLTGKSYMLDRHHIFKGSRRNSSEKYGLWVYLDHEVHMKLHSHSKPYETAENDLKILGQKAFEKRSGTREQFMSIFGVNYL